MKRPNPRNVNPYDSKAYKRIGTFIKRRWKNPKNVNPYSVSKIYLTEREK